MKPQRGDELVARYEGSPDTPASWEDAHLLTGIGLVLKPYEGDASGESMVH